MPDGAPIVPETPDTGTNNDTQYPSGSGNAQEEIPDHIQALEQTYGERITTSPTVPLELTTGQQRILDDAGLYDKTIPAISTPSDDTQTQIDIGQASSGQTTAVPRKRGLTRRAFLRGGLAGLAALTVGSGLLLEGNKPAPAARAEHKEPLPNPDIVSPQTMQEQITQIRRLLLDTPGTQTDSTTQDKVLWGIFTATVPKDGEQTTTTVVPYAWKVDTSADGDVIFGLKWYNTDVPVSGIMEYRHGGQNPPDPTGYDMMGYVSPNADTARADQADVINGGHFGGGFLDKESVPIGEERAQQVNELLRVVQFDQNATNQSATNNQQHYAPGTMTSWADTQEAKTYLFGTELDGNAHEWRDVSQAAFAGHGPSLSRPNPLKTGQPV